MLITLICTDTRGQKYLQSVFADIQIDVEWFTSLLKELNISYPISSNKENDVGLLTQSVNTVRLKNNPVKLTNNVLHDMYERIINKNEA